MLIRYASQQTPLTTDVQYLNMLESVSEDYLVDCVKTIAIPRHFQLQPQNNRQVANFINQQLQSFGYTTTWQGKYANIMTVLPNHKSVPCLLIGAHYDSVADTPGADDNGSAIAALLACAKAIATFTPETPVMFVAFNGEEENLLGSKDFVNHCIVNGRLKVSQVHILEMVGYCQQTPFSQYQPPGLPVQIPQVGNFLGMIGNRNSLTLLENTLTIAKSYLPLLPVLGLKVYLGLEHLFPVLKRSDHAPFWQAQVATLMWTDTAEFRNPHYHGPTDTPETLNYTFLRQVTQLLVACVLSFEERR